MPTSATLTWRPTPTRSIPATAATRAAGNVNAHAPRTCRRAHAPGRSGARRPGPATRHVQAGSRCTTRDRPGSVRRTRCRALAARGHDPPAPARGRLPRARPAQASRARRRAARGPRGTTTRSGRGLTRTHPGRARVRPATTLGRRRPGIRGNPGIRDRTSTSRHRPTPDRRRADRDRRTARRPGGRRDSRPARPGTAPASTPRGSHGPANPVQANPVLGRGHAQSRTPTVTGSRGRPASPATGRGNPGKGRPATGRVSSPPDNRDPASSARNKGQGRPARASSVPARSAGVRHPWAGRTARRPVRCRLSRARTATPTRTPPGSLVASRCPGSSTRARGTPARGRPPGRSRDLAGRVARERSART